MPLSVSASHCPTSVFRRSNGALGTRARQRRAADRRESADVPPHAPIEEVLALLDEGEAAGAWHYEEGHRGHL